VIENLTIAGFDGRAGTVIVDDIDVTTFVAAELDRKYPERIALRSMTTIDDYRATWDIVERLWSEAIAHAETLPASMLNERVDGEWSFLETLRHLVFALDVWVGKMLRGEESPWHRIGLPPSDSHAGAADMGIDLAADPALAEVVAVHAARMKQMREVIDTMTGAEFESIRTAVLAPEWGEESFSLRECLGVVINEHAEHRRFAVRDLAVVEAR
jgi:hypothetical protein